MFDLTMNATAQALSPFSVVERKATISVVGLGYVGAVSTACLSELGHRVIGVDVDAQKCASIAQGQSPIHEQSLGDMLSEGVTNGLISTTLDLVQAVVESDVTFVSVGTPTAADGSCDLKYIEQAAAAIGQGLKSKDDFHVVVMRCSVPPGSTMKVMTPIIEQISGKVAGRDFGVCFNPEFLREGVAIADFYAPPKTVIGSTDARTANIVANIYRSVDPNPLMTSIETAEMVKCVDNVWHATKVCFANEVGRLCKATGVDSHDVMDVFVQDKKLNLSPYYLRPGFAYGGSCLPKEVRAVGHIATQYGVDLPMIQNLPVSNSEHIQTAARMAKETGAKTIGILGLAFKAGTDDLRESPILEVMADLHAEGIDLVAHDNAVTRETPIAAQLAYVAHGSPGLAKIAEVLPEMLCDSVDTVLAKADTLIVVHDDPAYRDAVAAATGKPVIDLVRAHRDKVSNETYQGIAW